MRSQRWGSVKKAVVRSCSVVASGEKGEAVVVLEVDNGLAGQKMAVGGRAVPGVSLRWVCWRGTRVAMCAVCADVDVDVRREAGWRLW